MTLSTKTKRSLWCWLALSPLVIVVLFPFAVMLFTALKPASEIFVYPARWLPVHWQWSNFADMWQAANFGVALRNSAVISLLSTLLALAVSLPAAYAWRASRSGDADRIASSCSSRRCCRLSCWSSGYSGLPP